MLLAVLPALCALPAEGLLEVPPLRGRVNDLAHVLGPERAATLEAELAAYEEETAHQLVLLTLPSTHGEPIADFSVRVFEAWSLGQKDLDNGLLLVVAPEDRTAWITTGYGLEGAVPDLVAARIVREQMAPLFREQRLEEGIGMGIAALMEAARGERIAEAPASRQTGREPDAQPWQVVFFTSLLGSLFGSPLRRRSLRLLGAALAGGAAALIAYLVLGSPYWAAAAFVLGAIAGYLGPAMGSGTWRRGYGRGGFAGGGFGGGGFSGGGGLTGGGGAGGRW
jgi:uncharacterized protein